MFDALLMAGLTSYMIIGAGVFVAINDESAFVRSVAAALWPWVVLFRIGIIIGRPER